MRAGIGTRSSARGGGRRRERRRRILSRLEETPAFTSAMGLRCLPPDCACRSASGPSSRPVCGRVSRNCLGWVAAARCPSQGSAVRSGPAACAASVRVCLSSPAWPCARPAPRVAPPGARPLGWWGRAFQTFAPGWSCASCVVLTVSPTEKTPGQRTFPPTWGLSFFDEVDNEPGKTW